MGAMQAEVPQSYGALFGQINKLTSRRHTPIRDICTGTYLSVLNRTPALGIAA